MEYEETKKIVEEINSRPIFEEYLTPAKKSGFVCIGCNNGAGDKGTGAVIKNNKLMCGKCQRSYTNFDIIAYHLGRSTNGKDYNEVIEYCCGVLGVSYDETPKQKNFFTSKMNKKTQNFSTSEMNEKKAVEERKDYSEKFYPYVQSKLEDFFKKHGNWRGLSFEDLKEVRAGFNARDKEGEEIQCLIFPHNKFSYFERSITDKPLKVKQHHGKKVIYNPYNVLKCGETIFIVEGEIDCITIHKFGYLCISTGGAGEINLVMKTLATEFEGVEDKPKFIVMFDNNDDGTGQKAATNLIQTLRDAGYKAVNFILSPDLKYDSNEFLQKDSEAFSARLAEIYEEAEKKFILLENEIFGTKLNFFFQHKYSDSKDKYRHFENVQTGFSILDENQEFEAGIYIIGAPPSLGKTSFLWQLLEQTARGGNENTKIHCVFVSYEMDEAVLFSKSMARGVFELNRKENRCFEPTKNLTSTRIRKGIDRADSFFDQASKVLEKLKNDVIDLRVLDLTTCPLEIDDLIKRLEKIASALPTEDILIFGIDYLQRIPSDKDTIKAAIDDAMLKLKQFSQKTNSIIFLISSYNRNSYRVEASFDAFKESGSIEYGSDVMWALQLYSVDDKGKQSTLQADLDKAKMRQPRPMILKCLKNRFGNDYRIYFQYYSAVDTFIECDENEVNRA